MTRLPIPYGERDLTFVLVAALVFLGLTLAVLLLPSRHERSIRHHRGEMQE